MEYNYNFQQHVSGREQAGLRNLMLNEGRVNRRDPQNGPKPLVTREGIEENRQETTRSWEFSQDYYKDSFADPVLTRGN